MITCFIRYEIDAFKVDAFKEYARNWGAAIPQCGADLIGYYAPHEGSSTTAYRLRVAEVNRDYGLNNRTEAPTDSAELHG